MKKILILALFLALGWTGSTWFIGNETESLLKNTIKNTKNAYSESGMKVNIELKEYKKSFFKSTAKTVISIKTGDPEVDELFKEIQLNNTITHGPLLWVAGTLNVGTAHIHSTLDMDSLEPDTQEILKKLFANTSPFSSTLLFGLSETVDYTLTIPAIEIKEDASLLSLKDGLYLAGIFNKTSLMGTAKGTMGDININDDGLIIETSASNIDIDMQGMVAGQMLGTSHFTTPLIKIIIVEGMPPISFGIDLSSETQQVDNKALDGVIKLIASNIQAPIEMSDIYLSATFKGFQIKGLEQLASIQKDLQQLQSSVRSNDEMSIEEQDALMNKIQNLPNIMVAAVQNTLKKDETALSVNIDITSQQGNALLNVDSRYIGNGADINLEELSTNGLTALLKILAGNIEFNTPKTMIASTPVAFLMPPLVEQGLIAEDADNYRLNAIFKTDSITLNNKAISADEFITLLTALGLVGGDDELPEGAELSDHLELPTDLPAGVFEELSEQLSEEVQDDTQEKTTEIREAEQQENTVEKVEGDTQQSQ
jgi:hypothetical protein